MKLEKEQHRFNKKIARSLPSSISGSSSLYALCIRLQLIRKARPIIFWKRFIVSRSKYSVTKLLYIFKVKIFYWKTKDIAKEVKATSNPLFITLSLHMCRNLYIG